MNSLRLIALLVFIAAVVMYSGCTDNAPSGPAAGTGGVTVSKYVAIGNSLTSGYQSNGWFESAQTYSFPNLIAGQLKAAGQGLGSFEQPLWADPGTPGPDGVHASRYEILSLVGPVIGPNPSEIAGAPKNLALARPYDNLGIPGLVIASFLDTTNFLGNPLVPVVLRSQPAGPFPMKSVFQQAVSLNPDLVTFWLGNNDVLGYAASGGASPTSPTPSAVFAALYTQALGALRAALPNARIFVGNIPDVRVIPFFTTLGPKIAAKIPAGIMLRYQKHGNSGPSLDGTDFTEAKPPLILLTGSSYAGFLGATGGQGAGKWYEDNDYPALPPGIDTTKPFGFHPQNPWPDALVLDADEQLVAGNAVADFNNTIASVANADHAFVVDINGFLNMAKANGYVVAGQKFTTDYVTGGIFSLDGVHPTSRGSGLIANKFIATMNSSLGMNLPYVDVSAIPGIPAPISKLASQGSYPVIPYEAFSDLKWLWRADQ